LLAVKQDLNLCRFFPVFLALVSIRRLDLERLTFYDNGIEHRLIDVHGHVIADILA
jgi:hypothetical protein